MQSTYILKPAICLFLVSIVVFLIFFIPAPAEAAVCVGGTDEKCFGLHDAAGLAGFKAIEEEQEPAVIIGLVIQYVLSFVGVIFMILVIYGGFSWMFAQGSEEKITKARNLIIHAAIGLLIVLGAYLITRVVTDQIINIVQTTAAK